MNKLLRLIQENQRVNSVDELQTLLTSIGNELNHESFLFGLYLEESMEEEADVLNLINPRAWSEQYAESGYAHHDPVARYCMNHVLPINWDHVDKSERIGREIFEEARLNDLRKGFSVPFHGLNGEFGCMSFATSDGRHYDKMDEQILLAQLVTPLITENIAHFHPQLHSTAPARLLTARELQCLTWAAEGKSTWEIAVIIGCSERTAKFHLNNAAKKLGAVNRYQAITKAILRGYIQPQV